MNFKVFFNQYSAAKEFAMTTLSVRKIGGISPHFKTQDFTMSIRSLLSITHTKLRQSPSQILKHRPILSGKTLLKMEWERCQAYWCSPRLKNQSEVSLSPSTALSSAKTKFPQSATATMPNIEHQVLFLLQTTWLSSSLTILALALMPKMSIRTLFIPNRTSEQPCIFLMLHFQSWNKSTQAMVSANRTLSLSFQLAILKEEPMVFGLVLATLNLLKISILIVQRD